jgi:predicted esterase
LTQKIENPYGPLTYPYLEYRVESQLGFALVYLHGSGDNGTEFGPLERWALPYEILRNEDYWYQTICPVCPENERWIPEKVSDFLVQLKSTGLKGKRVILTGYSMGATGAYDLQSLYPDLVDGLVVVAGRTNVVDLVNLAGVPILAYYGELDERLKVSKISELRDSVVELGGQMELKILPGRDHYMPNEAYSDSLFYEWVDRVGEG